MLNPSLYAYHSASLLAPPAGDQNLPHTCRHSSSVVFSSFAPERFGEGIPEFLVCLERAVHWTAKMESRCVAEANHLNVLGLLVRRVQVASPSYASASKFPCDGRPVAVVKTLKMIAAEAAPVFASGTASESGAS